MLSTSTGHHAEATKDLVNATIRHRASLADRPGRPHNPKVAGSNPAPATNSTRSEARSAPAGRASSVAGCQRLVNTRWHRRPCAFVRDRRRWRDRVGGGVERFGWNCRRREPTRAHGRRLLPRPLGPQPEGRRPVRGSHRSAELPDCADVAVGRRAPPRRWRTSGAAAIRSSRTHQTPLRPDRVDGRFHRPMAGDVCGMPQLRAQPSGRARQDPS